MLRLARTMIFSLGCACLSATAAAQSPPTKKYGFCMASGAMVQGVQSKPYLSKTFETSWPVTVSLESRFLTFIKSKDGVTASRPYCYTYATLADAQRYRPEIVRDEAAWTAVDWTPAAATTPPTASKPQPAAPATTAAVPARTTAAAQQGANQPYWRCEITGRIANFVVAEGSFRQGKPPRPGDNQCAAPGASCQWSNGVLTLTGQTDGKPIVRIFDTVKGVYTTRLNGQDKVSPCTKVTN